MGKKKKEHVVFDQLERVRKRVNIGYFNGKTSKKTSQSKRSRRG